jgi:hypothetical protein
MIAGERLASRHITTTRSQTLARSTLHSIMSSDLTRDEVDRMSGAVVHEFGAPAPSARAQARDADHPGRANPPQRTVA